MKARLWVLIICAVSVLFFQIGCQPEEKKVDTLETADSSEVITSPVDVQIDVEEQAATAKKGPILTVETKNHDFGIIGPLTVNVAEFKFTNTGDEILKITKTKATCGCTVPELKKKEYAPGESGVIKVTYKAKNRAMKDTQTVTVYSNDKQNPKIALTVKAQIILKVVAEPEILKLELWQENANCPKITLKSKDGKPFSIKEFSATGSAMTINFDPNAVGTEFVFEPVVDASKLENVPQAKASFTLTHPECKQITLNFDLKQKYELSRKSIFILKGIVGEPEIKKLRVTSNSDQEFGVASTASKQGYVELLKKTKVGQGYDLELQITPPAQDGTKRFFVDTFYITMEDGARLMTTVQGYYKKEAD